MIVTLDVSSVAVATYDGRLKTKVEQRLGKADSLYRYISDLVMMAPMTVFSFPYLVHSIFE